MQARRLHASDALDAATDAIADLLHLTNGDEGSALAHLLAARDSAGRHYVDERDSGAVQVEGSADLPQGEPLRLAVALLEAEALLREGAWPRAHFRAVDARGAFFAGSRWEADPAGQAALVAEHVMRDAEVGLPRRCSIMAFVFQDESAVKAANRGMAA